MLGLGPATKVYVATGATDMRKGFEGLDGLVRDEREAAERGVGDARGRHRPQADATAAGLVPAGAGGLRDGSDSSDSHYEGIARKGEWGFGLEPD
ncbi:MAG: hypothetical protein IT169_10665 [Bryobacterales bacterium]|nr:hypothetical protein [Bryobacterales bacterium]